MPQSSLLSLDCYVTMNANVCCQPDDHELWYAEVAQADILITVPPSS